MGLYGALAWARGPAWAWARLGPGPGLGPGWVRLGLRPGLAQARAQVRPALRKDLYIYIYTYGFRVFASPEPVQSGSHLFFLGWSCRVRPALREDLCMVSLFLPHPSQCKAGRTCFSWEGVVECDLPCVRRVALFPGPNCIPRGRLVTGLATFLAQGLLFAFHVFASPEPVQSGSHFLFWEGVAECDLPCARRVALLLWEAS